MRDPLGRWLCHHMHIRFVSVDLGTAFVTIATACTRPLALCGPPHPDVSLDSLNTALAPLGLFLDSTTSPSRVEGVVLRAGARTPVPNTVVRFRGDTTRQVRTDSSGRFFLPIPSRRRLLLETLAVGYLPRRDTLEIKALRYKRLEVTLLDAYTLGDVEPVTVCTSARGRS